MKNKKGAEGGAGGHVEVSMKVVSPSMTTLEQLKKQASKDLDEHPAMKFANNAIVLQAIRSGTTGYTGKETLDDFLDSAIEKAFLAGKDQEAVDCKKHCQLAYEKGKKGEPMYFEEVVKSVLCNE